MAQVRGGENTGPRVGRVFRVPDTGLVAVVALALVVSGCASAAAPQKTVQRASHKPTTVVISTAKNASLGTLLVAQKKTVYTLKPTTVSCSAACISVWPEVTLPKGVLKATAGAGINAAKLGSVVLAGGIRQVTYAGKALYWFSADSAPGQVKGNKLTDQWGTWSAYVTANAPKSSSTNVATNSHPTTTVVSGSYGY
ncbi:MAG TPA: hypothetical protein VMU99_04695 [Acidimicrobiales bacterium]|nr:hypothetical protein [Acidimicrobiales bacterium]